MGKEFEFVERAKRILTSVPPYASDGEKIAAICRRFRLNHRDAKTLMRKIES